MKTLLGVFIWFFFPLLILYYSSKVAWHLSSLRQKMVGDADQAAQESDLSTLTDLKDTTGSDATMTPPDGPTANAPQAHHQGTTYIGHGEQMVNGVYHDNRQYHFHIYSNSQQGPDGHMQSYQESATCQMPRQMIENSGALDIANGSEAHCPTCVCATTLSPGVSPDKLQTEA